MNLGPLAGLLGAVLASFSILKWIMIGFIVILVLWILSTAKNAKNALDSRAIKDLIKSAAQWNSRASQDSNPLIALMNSNYAMAYLNVARSIGSDADIERYTNAAVDELLKDLEGTQSMSIQKITTSCPKVTPHGLAAVHTGWLSK
jgi:hypothetical protein